ncbi:MAG: sulfatase family protein [Terriglobales bacterium]
MEERETSAQAVPAGGGDDGISRRKFLHGVAGTLGAAALPGVLTSQAGASGQRPNFVFLLGEGVRYDEMSWAGNPIIKTPNIDRLAREGVAFRNAFVVNALCSPTRATLLTGMYSHTTGVIDNRDRSIPPEFPLISDMLRDAGYEVAFVGKSHVHGSLRDHDWDYYFGFNGQAVYYHPAMYEGSHGQYTGPTFYDGYVDDLLAERAVKWISQRKKDKPFCLFLWFYAPHAPFYRSRDLLDLYNGVPIPVPDTFNDDLKGYPGKPKFADAYNKIGSTQVADDDPRSLEEVVKDHYAGTVSNDKHVGDVIGALDKNGHLNDTAILLSSDHGFFLGEWRMYDKRFMHEPSIRVPLIVWYPKGIKAGLRPERMALDLDIAPTVLEMAGIAVPKSMQGKSLVPFFRGSDPSGWRKDWFYEYFEYPDFEQVPPQHGIRTERYKLIHYYVEPEAFELYDLQQDPGERNNLYGDPRYASLVSQLRARMQELRKESGDTWQYDVTRAYMEAAPATSRMPR